MVELGVQAQVERHLQLAIQSAIDVALHVVAEASPETPETYGSAFAQLADQEILDEALAERLRRATGLRNLLVNGYLDVDPVLVWNHLQHLGDLRAFAVAIEAYLGREE